MLRSRIIPYSQSIAIAAVVGRGKRKAAGSKG